MSGIWHSVADAQSASPFPIRVHLRSSAAKNLSFLCGFAPLREIFFFSDVV